MLPEKINISTFEEFKRQIEGSPNEFLVQNFISFVMNDEVTFKRVIYSYDNLVELLKICPGSKEEVLAFILERNQVFNSFFFFTNITRVVDDFNCCEIFSKYVDLIICEQNVTSKVPNFYWLLNFTRRLHDKDKKRLVGFFKKNSRARRELFDKG